MRGTGVKTGHYTRCKRGLLHLWPVGLAIEVVSARARDIEKEDDMENPRHVESFRASGNDCLEKGTRLTIRGHDTARHSVVRLVVRRGKFIMCFSQNTAEAPFESSSLVDGSKRTFRLDVYERLTLSVE